MKRTILRPFLFLFLSVALLGLGGGCATLPKVSESIDNASIQEPPQILSSRGFLSPEKSKALMERLKGSGASTDMVERYSAVIESVSGSPLTSGNKVTLLIDGAATYAAMFKAMENARDHINLETYIMEDDEIGRRFADLVLKKQAKGVEVNLIYDSRGSFSTPASVFNACATRGPCRRLQPGPSVEDPKIWKLANPNHRKILIVDGKAASREASTSARCNRALLPGGAKVPGGTGHVAATPWRDTDVQVEGPVVAEFQKLFLDTWKRQKGPELPKRNYFPDLKATGKTLVRGRQFPGGDQPAHFHLVCVRHHFLGKFAPPDERIFRPRRRNGERSHRGRQARGGREDRSSRNHRFFHGLERRAVLLFEAFGIGSEVIQAPRCHAACENRGNRQRLVDRRLHQHGLLEFFHQRRGERGDSEQGIRRGNGGDVHQGSCGIR